MKYFLILALSVSLSGCAQNFAAASAVPNPTPNQQVPANSKPPKGRRTNPKMMSNTANSMPHVPTLDEQAEEKAQVWVDSRIIKCGNYFRVGIHSGKSYLPSWFVQIVHRPTFTVEGDTIAPRNLSEAARLNGEDPQPVQWLGKIHISFGPYRGKTQDADGIHWMMWQDPYKIDVLIQKMKGQWYIGDSYEETTELIQLDNCSQIPEEPK